MAQLGFHAFIAWGSYAPPKPQLGFQKLVAGLDLDQRHGPIVYHN